MKLPFAWNKTNRAVTAMILTITLLIGGFIVVVLALPEPLLLERNSIRASAVIYDDQFYVNVEGQPVPQVIKGVNMGATLPGYFPGELPITYEDYLRWFGYIHAMHANTIRVYTIMNPAFYNALFDFNATVNTKLYVMQGIYLNEDDIATWNDPYANNHKIKNDFIQAGKDLVDIFHGRKTLPPTPGHASGSYTKNVSQYISAWILGVEWDPNFVHTTMTTYPNPTQYKGRLLTTKDASAFEIFLAEVGDAILAYEIDKYRFTRPLSYTNWLTTDPLDHPMEPDPNEDLVSVNVENIYTTKEAFAGQFASYHVYPYYPEFLNFHTNYITYRDSEGDLNPYKAYLEDLHRFHRLPILVAEFGVPSSRGKAHDQRITGYNQGQLSETQQGEILVGLYRDIIASGSLGGLLFNFQDEWFKRTWNTMDYDVAWQRPYWSNVETNEQFFGLLAMDPGETTRVVLDGNTSEWTPIAPLMTNDNLTLKVTHDERYLYLLVEHETTSLRDHPFFLAFDTIAQQGNTAIASTDVSFTSGVDFLITLHGTPRIQVDGYYDAFSYLYGHLNQSLPYSPLPKNSGIFQSMYHALSSELVIPVTNEVIPFSKYETGRLSEGISDPQHADYNSLADFTYGTRHVELRIPWLLLNIMDPSTKTQMKDFQGSTAFEGQSFDSLFIGVGNGSMTIPLAPFTYDGWSMPTYHERLKPAYYAVKDLFETYP